MTNRKTTELPLAPRETAPYFVSISHYSSEHATVYVKEGNYFRELCGLTEEWGQHWTGIEAVSLNDARLKAHASVGTHCPYWHLEAQATPEEREKLYRGEYP